MFDPDNLLRCDFCENGTVTKHIEQIKFRQLTDRGYIFCRAEVPIVGNGSRPTQGGTTLS